MQTSRSFESLVAIMDRLRDPGGCPWDREQTYETLRGFLLEEAYEVAEAIDAGDPEGLREELGDLLFQVVFLARLGKEDGRFDAGDVVEGIAAKMVRRHPHVFADDSAEDADAVLRKWEAIKRKEKEGHSKTDEDIVFEKAQPIRNHGLFSKAEAALTLAGWSEKARRDIEIFPLEDFEGLTPILGVLADDGTFKAEEEAQAKAAEAKRSWWPFGREPRSA